MYFCVILTGHVWSNRQPVAYTNWDVGQPDSYNGLEACVQLNPNTGYWSDVNCLARNAFVCKRPKFKKIGLTPLDTYPTPGSPLCKQNWTLFRGKCYFIGNGSSSELKTWQDAEATCKSMNGHLVSINDDTEVSFLVHLLKNSPVLRSWIGLNDIDQESDYKWSDGTPFGRYYNWDRGEPDDLHRQEDCVLMDRYGFWNDYHCSYKVSYICKSHNESYSPPATTAPPRPPSDGYCAPGWIANGQWCYEIHTDPTDYRNWWDAKDACERGQNSSDLGELVSITDAFEEAFLTLHIKDAKAPLWIGMNSLHHSYFWADGSPLRFLQWKKGQPSYSWYYWRGHCVEILPKKAVAGKWSAAYCWKRNGYICKTATSKTPNTTMPTNPPVTTEPSDFKCPQGYQVYDDSCYKVFNTSKTFDDARKTCKAEKAKLMSTESPFKQALLVYLLERFVGNVWIGLLRKPYASFSFTSHAITLYTNWGKGQPNRHPGERSCTQVNVTKWNIGAWDDVECTQKNPFVCEIYNGDPKITPSINLPCPSGWFKYDKFCYKFFNDRKTWPRAQYACSINGSNLVSIHNGQEEILMSLYEGNSYIWTGLHDQNMDGGYTWVDKSELNYVNWDSYQPYSYPGQDRCVSINPVNGKWRKSRCQRSHPYICKQTLECSSVLSVYQSMITISDTYDETQSAEKAIIRDGNSTESAWCTNNTAGTAFIQVDFKRFVQVTKISIQGQRIPVPRFVRSFRIDYNEEGYWKPYIFAGYQTIVQGNRDGKSVVTKLLESPITLDKIRITPVTWQYGPLICMKIKLHGCDYVCQNDLMESPRRLHIDFITAESGKYPANGPVQALPIGNTWCAKNNDKRQWIQVNFENVYVLSRIATFGDGKRSFVKTYMIQFRVTNESWVNYEQYGETRIFRGNSDAVHPVTQTLTNTIKASIVRVWPLSWNNSICMRLQLFGCRADCDKAILEPVKGNPGIKLSSSDQTSHPEYAVFSSGKAWCTNRSPIRNQYLQIDLGQTYQLKRITVRGGAPAHDKASQVLTFTVSYLVGETWMIYISKTRKIKIFTSVKGKNVTKSTTNLFSGKGLLAKNLRVYPRDFNGTEICMRVEIYGCIPEAEAIPTTQPVLQTTAEVSIRFTSMVWNDSLSDKQSTDFLRASNEIEKAIWTVYRYTRSFRDVKVQQLREGSVVAVLKMVYNAKLSEIENLNIVLKKAVNTGKIGSLEVDKNSFKIIGQSSPTATPREWTPSLSARGSTELPGGAVAGVVFSVLFLVCLAVGVGILLYRKRRRNNLYYDFKYTKKRDFDDD